MVVCRVDRRLTDMLPSSSGDGNKVSVKPDQMNIDTLMQTVNKHAKKLEEADQANAW
jgi:hypothetical protein